MLDAAQRHVHNLLVFIIAEQASFLNARYPRALIDPAGR